MGALKQKAIYDGDPISWMKGEGAGLPKNPRRPEDMKQFGWEEAARQSAPFKVEQKGKTMETSWKSHIEKFWNLFWETQKMSKANPGFVSEGQLDTSKIGEGLEDEADLCQHEEVAGSKLHKTIKSLEEQIQELNERLNTLRPVRAEIMKMNKEYGSAPQQADQIRDLWTWTREEIKNREDILNRLLQKQKEEVKDLGPNKLHWNGAWKSWDRVIGWLCTDRPSIVALAKTKSKVTKARKQKSVSFAHFVMIRFLVAAKQKDWKEANKYYHMIHDYKLRDRVREMTPVEMKEMLSLDDREPGEKMDETFCLDEGQMIFAIDCRARGINSIEFFEKEETEVDTVLDPRRFYVDTWAAAGFNKTKAAESLGMSRGKFTRYLNKEIASVRR